MTFVRTDKKEDITVDNQLERGNLYAFRIDSTRTLYIDTRTDETYVYVGQAHNNDILYTDVRTSPSEIVNIGLGFDGEYGYSAFFEWLSQHLNNEKSLEDVDYHISGIVIPDNDRMPDEFVIGVEASQVDY